MTKIQIILFCFLTITIACSKDNIDKTHLTYDDFKNHLSSETDYTEIVKTFGEPATDIGSGIHIYVYELTDLTEIWIGYTDKIEYAKHVDKNQSELHILI